LYTHNYTLWQCASCDNCVFSVYWYVYHWNQVMFEMLELLLTAVIKWFLFTPLPSVLWRCWLGGRKGIRPVKTGWWGTGVFICLEQVANDLHGWMMFLLPNQQCKCTEVLCDALRRNHTHSHFTAISPGPPGWAGASRELLDFMVHGRGRHTDHPAGRHSIRTNHCPPPPSPHFLQAGCPSCRPSNSVKALKATSTFGLGRRRWSSPHRCYQHRLCMCIEKIISGVWLLLTDASISWCRWSLEVVSAARLSCVVSDVDHWLLEYDWQPLPSADILPALHSRTDSSVLVSKCWSYLFNVFWRC